MYETARMRASVDRLWESIREYYGHGPAQLDRTTDPHVTWVDPDLVLSQTCGLPYRSVLFDQVQLLGTPDYGVAGCPPGYYRSHLVVHADDTRDTLDAFEGARLARNDTRSQSGWAAVAAHVMEEVPEFRFSEGILETGSHLNSLRAVRAKTADIAGIDAVTWAILARDSAATEDLKILISTRPTPGLPFITGLRQDVRALRTAVNEAIASLAPEDRELLMVRDLVWIPTEAYRAVPTPGNWSLPAN